jgi:hypothetical protein
LKGEQVYGPNVLANEMNEWEEETGEGRMRKKRRPWLYKSKFILYERVFKI